MRTSLPPLNAVKAFEASGRLCSLTLAASELGVTHGALSRQIKILEDWLGVRLFVREGRGISLTSEGRQFLKEATKALDKLSRAGEALAGQNERRVLRVSASQTFTMRWLIQRLPSFSTAHPDIEVRLSASILPPDQLTERFDLAIRRGMIGRYGESVPFLRETCVPVASPALLARQPVHSFSDLQEHVLIHAQSVADLWPRWLRSVGMPEIEGRSQLRFDPLYHSLQAALDGVGIAMGPSALVAEDVRQGRLVQLFADHPLAMDDFHVLIADQPQSLRHARTFRDWLLSEGADSFRASALEGQE
ncbi:LysR substrate-binding domain-containing protein [Rhizobium oryzicola]|uniref:LysR substrate-binding domain-containing protein n=1 Tax=Rhizobium oryzicola TaxID=1232668 RepID=A0ABT8SW17_9HYPH|nr:LysR substrate-binding domain-containing protein [Rhizobium oryzicola]MDO1582526.1 LysR substrate-binding domain-containing protein [Rhizobium oryzicola]